MAWLAETERRLIDQVLSAFAWRAKPSVVSSERETRAVGEKTTEVLTGVPARDVSDHLFDLALPNFSFFSISFTPEANLYYTPVAISRCVREIGYRLRQRKLGTSPVGGPGGRLARSLARQFRYYPGHLGRPVSEWPGLLAVAAGEDVEADPDVMDWVDECGAEMLMDETRIWLMVDFQPDDTYIWSWRHTLKFLSMMTTEERRAFVAFLDYVTAAGAWPDELGFTSARALLAGRGAIDVLCIRTAAECIEVAEALHALETRHPKDFPARAVAPVKNLLRDIAAGRRSPDTKLGW